MRINFFRMKQLTAPKTATSSLSSDYPSTFCLVNLGGKCAQAGMKRDLSGLVENTVSFNIQEYRKFRIFGRMERAHRNTAREISNTVKESN